ncbi:MAG: hypothetical protein EOM59_14705 [Clostridia bacterium]|nr:hypothetical protein [Clostridia bacterium]
MTNNEEWNIACYANGTTADTTAVTVDGWVTGAYNFLKVYTPVNANEAGVSQRHGGKWDEGKYLFSYGNNLGNAINILEEYVKIDGLQISVTNQTYDKTAINVDPTNDLEGIIDISNNIFKAVSVSTNGLGAIWTWYNSSGGTAVVNVFNNSFFDFDNGAGGTTVSFYYYAYFNFFNNTIYNSAFGVNANSWDGVMAKNNIINDCSDDCYYTSFSWRDGTSNNISSDGTAPGANSKINTTVSFIDVANKDFHLSQSDTAAKNAGTDLSTYFSTDIDGASRNSSINVWDIGADETATQIYRSVGPSATGLLASDSSHANTVTLTSGVATFSVALADNIGVGDAVIIDTGGTDQAIDASDTLLFIKARNSSTSYQLQSNDGSVPGDIPINDTYQIYRAYTSLYNAEAGTKNTSIPITFNGGNRDLLTNNEEWNIACYANGTTIDSNPVTVDGWITGGDNFIKIYTPTLSTEVGVSQRHGGKWDDSKYNLKTSSVSDCIRISDPYTVLDGIQIYLNNTIMSSVAPWATNVTISNNIIKRNNDGEGNNAGITSGENFVFIFNNIIYNFGNGIHASGNSTNWYINNNTIYNCINGIARYNGIIVAKNNIAQNCTDGFVGTFDSASDYNISDLASDAPGSNSKNSTTVEFVNEAGYDFHLAQTDTAARGAGANLTADANLPFSTDIDGQLRNPSGAGWDIGADEGTVEFVATVMQSGGNFSTLSSWEDAIDSDLVADTTRVFAHGGITGTIVGGNTVTGLTSGATATVVYATSTQILLHTVSGIFQSGETLQVTAGNSVVISDNGNPASAVAKIDGAWTVADTTAVDINGWTSGPDNYIKVYTTEAARHKGKWDDGKYRLISSISSNYIRAPYVRFDGLQISSSANYSGAANFITGSINSSISNSIIKAGGIPADSLGGIANSGGIGTKVINSIVYGYKNGSLVGFRGIQASIGDISVYNTTVANCHYGFYQSHQNIKAVNTISFQNDIGHNLPKTSYISGTNYNISSDSTAPGSSGSKINAEVKFISTETGNEDFHLHPDDRFAIDAGTDLSTYFTNDIDGMPRSGSWDIGADELPTQIYRSVGPSKTDTLDNDTSHSKNVTLTGGVATFSAPLPDNVGVGDVVIIDTDNDEAITSADTLLFISKRNSSTSYQLQTHTGATPSDITINDTYQIYRAHTSLANAESGTINSTLSGLGFTFNGGDRDLVANNEQWNIACYANGTTADTTSVTVDGWITGENNFIKIYTPVRLNEVGVSQRHDGKNDLVENYKISNIASLSAIYLYVNYVVVEGVEISNYGSVGYSVAAINLYNSNYSSISHNLIYDEVSGNNGYAISIPNYGYRGSKIFNNIIYNVFTGIRDNRGDNNLIYIYNNTISSCSNVGIYSGAAGTLVKNNIVQSCADGYSGTFDASSDYNISDLASDAPGTNSKNSTNVLFLDEVGYDFRLSSDDTAAKGAGLNLSTDADLSFFDDIRGQARPKSPEAWSIGASEPQSAGKIKLEGTQIKMEGDAKFE